MRLRSTSSAWSMLARISRRRCSLTASARSMERRSDTSMNMQPTCSTSSTAFRTGNIVRR